MGKRETQRGEAPLLSPNKVDPSPSTGEAVGEGDTRGPKGWLGGSKAREWWLNAPEPCPVPSLSFPRKRESVSALGGPRFVVARELHLSQGFGFGPRAHIERVLPL
jgi:hypothetical protein